jgi:hypothetical protein
VVVAQVAGCGLRLDHRVSRVGPEPRHGRRAPALPRQQPPEEGAVALLRGLARDPENRADLRPRATGATRLVDEVIDYPIAEAAELDAQPAGRGVPGERRVVDRFCLGLRDQLGQLHVRQFVVDTLVNVKRVLTAAIEVVVRKLAS